MRLQYVCVSCRQPNKYTPVAATRGDLQMKMGDEVQVSCKRCKEEQKVHLNKISAAVNNKWIVISFLISLIISLILWILFTGIWLIIAIPIPMILWAAENNAVRNFNRYRIRKK